MKNKSRLYVWAPLIGAGRWLLTLLQLVQYVCPLGAAQRPEVLEHRSDAWIRLDLPLLIR